MVEEIDGAASIGNIIRYKLTVKNPNKNMPIHNFVVVDPLPAHLALVAGSIKVVPDTNAHIIETNSANEIRVVFTSLAAAAIVQIHFDAKIVGSGADGRIVNIARIHKHKPNPQGRLGDGILGEEVNRADEIVDIEKDSVTPKEKVSLNKKTNSNEEANPNEKANPNAKGNPDGKGLIKEASKRSDEALKNKESVSNGDSSKKENSPKKAADDENREVSETADNSNVKVDDGKSKGSDTVDKPEMTKKPEASNQSEPPLKGMLSSLSALLTSKLNGTPKKEKRNEEMLDEKLLDQQYDRQYDQEYDQEFDQLFGD